LIWGLNKPATADLKPAFVPSKDQLSQALEICDDEGDLVLRSYILVVKDCAMSQIDLIKHNVNEDYYDERLKTRYHSVISQHRKGKVPIAIVGRRIKTEIPYVGFLGQEAYDSLKPLKFAFKGSRLIGFESNGNIQKKFRKLQKYLDQPLLKAKSLRAYAATAIRSGDINEIKAKIITGHKIRDIDYVNFDIDVLSQAYQRVYPKLRVLT
jgi:hypothetical protein